MKVAPVNVPLIFKLFNVAVPETFKSERNNVLPLTFNVEFNVVAPEINILVKFVLFNNDVDVAFKLLINKVELVDKLFKLVNIVFDVLFKLVIDNLELVDKLFKLVNIVFDVLFILLIDSIELVDKLFAFFLFFQSDNNTPD